MAVKNNKEAGAPTPPAVQTPIFKGAMVQEESGEALVPIADSEAFRYFDRRDEEQIVATLEGRYIEEFIYRFERDGRVIVGLSWTGVQEAARECGAIAVDLVESKETDEEMIYMVKSTDLRTGSSRLGIAAQPKKMKLREGRFVEDVFYRQKALSKAQRNALRPQIPQTVIKAWIEKKLAESEGDGNKGRLPPAKSTTKPRSSGATPPATKGPEPTPPKDKGPETPAINQILPNEQLKVVWTCIGLNAKEYGEDFKQEAKEILAVMLGRPREAWKTTSTKEIPNLQFRDIFLRILGSWANQKKLGGLSFDLFIKNLDPSAWGKPGEAPLDDMVADDSDALFEDL